MPLEYKKIEPVKLRTLGYDENWLKQKIEDDPSIMGLGDINVIQTERSQPSGGRIDFLMSDPESNIRYEVEVMLGKTDESHIIRTIEYWDIERKRYPTYDHRAVIIAEELNSRFFNIISLFNQHIPLIAIQLGTFKVDNNIVLHFTKVLDVLEHGAEDEIPSESTDRQYWMKRTHQTSMALFDEIAKLVPETESKLQITYNKHHIALGTSGYNFIWVNPRKTANYCHFNIRTSVEDSGTIKQQLQEAGIDADALRGREDLLGVGIYRDAFDKNRELLKNVIEKCEGWSRE